MRVVKLKALCAQRKVDIVAVDRVCCTHSADSGIKRQSLNGSIGRQQGALAAGVVLLYGGVVQTAAEQRVVPALLLVEW